MWDGRTWVPDEDRSLMLRAALSTQYVLTDEARTAEDKRWAEKSGNAGHLDAMVRVTRGFEDCQAVPKDFDRNVMLLTCNNGTLNLGTGEFRESFPEDMLTSKCDVAYDVNAKCPTFERYLSEALPDLQVQAFMRRWLGYCLTGCVNEQKFVVCWGERGSNGKSLLFGVLNALLGDKYAWTAQPKLLLDNDKSQHDTIYASLCGKRLCMVSEIKVGRVWDEAAVKNLTGGDRINCRRMHEDEWVFEPTHKIMVATNPKPRVRDTSDAFWRRLILVPFEVSFTGDKADPGLKDKLLKELPGILNWMVEGCREWRANGLQVPEKLTAATQDYREDEDQDRVGAWIDKHFVFEQGCMLESAEIQALIDEWNARNKNLIYMNTLSQRLQQKGAKRMKTKEYRGYEGVRRRTQEESAVTPGDTPPRVTHNYTKPIN